MRVFYFYISHYTQSPGEGSHTAKWLFESHLSKLLRQAEIEDGEFIVSTYGLAVPESFVIKLYEMIWANVSARFFNSRVKIGSRHKEIDPCIEDQSTNHRGDDCNLLGEPIGNGHLQLNQKKKMRKINLGDKVQHVSGFEGKVVQYCEHLNGHPDTVLVDPQARKKDGSTLRGEWFDVDQLSTSSTLGGAASPDKQSATVAQDGPVEERELAEA